MGSGQMRKTLEGHTRQKKLEWWKEPLEAVQGGSSSPTPFLLLGAWPPRLIFLCCKTKMLVPLVLPPLHPYCEDRLR